MGDLSPYILLLIIVVAAGIKLLLRGSPLLSIAPRVAAGPGWLIATSSFPAMLLSLFSYSRAVCVDSDARQVHVRSRYLWFCRWHKVVRFDEVEKILYFLSDLSPATTIGATGDTIDRFKVQLRLHDGSDVHLTSFVGAGTFQRGWDTWWFLPDWLFTLERTFDMSGAQAIQSREFLDRLQRLLQVPVGRPAS